MLCLFECFLAPGHDGSSLLTEETIDDTQAQIMTDSDAEQIGFSGLPPNTTGNARIFVVCAPRDARRIQHSLELSPQVAQYRQHEVNA